MKTRFTTTILTASLVASGCAGSRTNVTFNEAKTPISLSGSLFDENGMIIDSDDYKVVRHFETEQKRSWALFYSLGRIHKQIDFSQEVNDAIAQAKGEGVVNLEVMTQSCGINMAIPLILLPFWPGCVRVWVSGDVMTREGVEPPPPPAPIPDPTPPIDPPTPDADAQPVEDGTLPAFDASAPAVSE